MFVLEQVGLYIIQTKRADVCSAPLVAFKACFECPVVVYVCVSPCVTKCEVTKNYIINMYTF